MNPAGISNKPHPSPPTPPLDNTWKYQNESCPLFRPGEIIGSLTENPVPTGNSFWMYRLLHSLVGGDRTDYGQRWDWIVNDMAPPFLSLGAGGRHSWVDQTLDDLATRARLGPIKVAALAGAMEGALYGFTAITWW